jgi:hypothetical protein
MSKTSLNSSQTAFVISQQQNYQFDIKIKYQEQSYIKFYFKLYCNYC